MPTHVRHVPVQPRCTGTGICNGRIIYSPAEWTRDGAAEKEGEDRTVLKGILLKCDHIWSDKEALVQVFVYHGISFPVATIPSREVEDSHVQEESPLYRT